MIKPIQMRIRLHEIEMGAASTTTSAAFFSSILGLPVKLEENTLTIFDSGMKGLDLNVSDHLLPGTTRVSFLTDDLDGFIQRLKEQTVAYEGPYASHLGMLSVRFVSPDGIQIVVNTVTDSSPEWLKV